MFKLISGILRDKILLSRRMGYELSAPGVAQELLYHASSFSLLPSGISRYISRGHTVWASLTGACSTGRTHRRGRAQDRDPRFNQERFPVLQTVCDGWRHVSRFQFALGMVNHQTSMASFKIFLFRRRARGHILRRAPARL